MPFLCKLKQAFSGKLNVVSLGKYFKKVVNIVVVKHACHYFMADWSASK